MSAVLLRRFQNIEIRAVTIAEFNNMIIAAQRITQKENRKFEKNKSYKSNSPLTVSFLANELNKNT